MQYHSQVHNAKDLLPGSGEWLLEHEEFLKWKQKTDDYIHKQLLLNDWPNKEELRAVIIEKTVAGASQMLARSMLGIKSCELTDVFRFRWADMHIEVLATLSTEADLRVQLGRNPPELEDLYNQLYDDIIKMAGGVVGQSIIRNTFKWLVCGTTSFRSSDFILAVSMTLSVSSSEVRPEQILRLCRNFVLHDNELDVFRFSHLSVREYLEKHPLTSVSASHSLAAEACLMDLIAIPGCNEAKEFLFRDCGVDVSGRLLSLIELEINHFHNYARENWMHHFRSAEQAKRSTGRLKQLIGYFLLAETPGPTPFDQWLPWHSGLLSWQYGYDRENAEYVIHPDGTNKRSSKIFLVACRYGLPDVVMFILESDPPDESLMDAGLSILFYEMFEGRGKPPQNLAQNHHCVLGTLRAANSKLQLTDVMLKNLIKSVRYCKYQDRDLSSFQKIFAQWPDKKVTFSMIETAILYKVDDATLKLFTDRAATTDMLTDQALEELAQEHDCNSPHARSMRLLIARLNGVISEDILISAYFPQLNALLQNCDNDAITEKVLLHVLDGFHRPETPKLLAIFTRASDESITPKVFTEAVSSCDMVLMKYMLDRTGRTVESAITKDLVLTAVRRGDISVMSYILDNGGKSLVDTETLTVAIKFSGMDVILELLSERKDIPITYEMMRQAVRAPHLLEILLCHGAQVTQPLVEMAAGSCKLEVFITLLENGGRITHDVAVQALESPSDSTIR